MRCCAWFLSKLFLRLFRSHRRFRRSPLVIQGQQPAQQLFAGGRADGVADAVVFRQGVDEQLSIDKQTKSDKQKAALIPTESAPDQNCRVNTPKPIVYTGALVLDG